jgi:catechol 2,3-dioxygenase-like lactoylglutathione lyase family enzyme
MDARFHMSLNVSDLSRSVAFYRLLLGAEPTKLRDDYAKFEPVTPPVVLALEPRPPGSGGALNHVGFRMPNREALLAMHARLAKAGLNAPCEEGVECCYARQTKFWTHDPDGTLWEIYTFDGDLDHRGAGQSPAKIAAVAPSLREPIVWMHRLTQPVPDRIPLADGSADEVRLQGTFNAALTPEARTRLLTEAHRVLAPDGRLFVHVLTAERTFEGHPDLPGPASVVAHVPVDAEVVASVEAAGFVDVRMVKFNARPCFERQGVPMRELQLEGRRPAPSKASVRVLYKGPFRELEDDQGNRYPRGRWVQIDQVMAERLAAPEWTSHFVVLDGGA